MFNSLITSFVPLRYYEMNKLWTECLSNIQYHHSSSVLIGTSVVRELMDGDNKINAPDGAGYNCGLSAHTTSLSFHMSLMLAVLDIDSEVKNLYVGISIHDLLNDDGLMLNSIGTSVYSVNSLMLMYLKYGLFDGVEGLLRDIKYVMFPLSKLSIERYFLEDEVEQKGKNYYFDKTFSIEKLKEGELAMLEGKKSVRKSISDLRDMIAIAKERNVDVRYVLLPQNKTFLHQSFSEYEVGLINDLIKNTFENVIDYSDYVSSGGFADCCHLNSMGRLQVLEKVSNR